MIDYYDVRLMVLPIRLYYVLINVKNVQLDESFFITIYKHVAYSQKNIFGLTFLNQPN